MLPCIASYLVEHGTARWKLTSGDGRGHGVFARQLRSGAFLTFLLPLQPRFARPGAIEGIFDAEPQSAQPFSFQLDRIAVHERVQAAVVGARSQNIARLEGV